MMKKLLLFSLVAGSALISVSGISRPVKFMVVDSNYNNPDEKLTDVKFKGAMSSWSDFQAYDDGTNGDAVSGDGIWTADYTTTDGTYEWGATDAGGTVWLISGPNQKFTLNTDGTITGVQGDTVWRMAYIPVNLFKRDVKFLVRDSNFANSQFKFTDVKVKGSFSGWADVQAYDDGSNGDAVGSDGVWTAVYNVKEGTYEWGGTNAGNWFIVGPNKSFTMSSAGVISGDTTYGISKVGALINVTFNVDMSDTIVNSEGVYVSGNFLSWLENKVNDWNKDTIKLDKVGSTKMYTKTLKMYAGKYQWKFYNGKGNADDSRGENWITAACGEKDGFGNYNRVLNLTGKTTAQVLPLYKWNSCTVSTAGNPVLISSDAISIAPNPSQGNFTVSLSGATLKSVHVLGLDGRLILSQASGIVTAGNLPMGMYLLKVYDSMGRTATHKIVIQ